VFIETIVYEAYNLIGREAKKVNKILCFMTIRFNKQDFIENQAKLDILTTFLTCLNAALEIGNFDH
jgi:hypothetical protein